MQNQFGEEEVSQFLCSILVLKKVLVDLLEAVPVEQQVIFMAPQIEAFWVEIDTALDKADNVLALVGAGMDVLEELL